MWCSLNALAQEHDPEVRNSAEIWFISNSGPSTMNIETSHKPLCSEMQHNMLCFSAMFMMMIHYTAKYIHKTIMKRCLVKPFLYTRHQRNFFSKIPLIFRLECLIC